MKYTQIPEALLEKIVAGDCILFLGAGATRDAGGPTGRELAELLANRFSRPDIPVDNIQHFSDILTSLPEVDREEIDSAIIDALRNLKPSPGHWVIPRVPWKALFTLNYDRLIEQAYDGLHGVKDEKPQQSLKVIIGNRQTAFLSDSSVVSLYKIHGCISNIEKKTPLVLTSIDYERTRKNRRKMLRVLRDFAHEHTILFVGYSFSDPHLITLLKEMEEESPYRSHRTMYLISNDTSDSEVAFFESNRIKVIQCAFSAAFSEISSFLKREANKQVLAARLTPIREARGEIARIPPRLRVSLDHQIEILDRDVSPQRSATRFLSGQLPTAADLKNRNDIERKQHVDIIRLLDEAIVSDNYLCPLIMVLGSGGSGKSTIACRAAYDFVEQSKAIACRLKSHELVKTQDIVSFAKALKCPIIFIAEGLEISAQFRKMTHLRNSLSSERCQAVIVASCQKAVWNEHFRKHPQKDVVLFSLDDRLVDDEARALVDLLHKHRMLAEPYSSSKDTRHVRNIIDDCEGHLVVAMLELVKNSRFRTIIIGEFENLTERAREAYKYVALIHQHRLSVPDYLLNQLALDDWNLFINEVIRSESEFVILQDLSKHRIYFRTRHPIVAKTIVDHVLPKHEDRVRTYREVIRNLGASEEDRHFLLDLLTSKSALDDIREDKYVKEFFETALDLFPEDELFILHLGKFQNQRRNLEDAYDILSWGRRLNPRNTHILHQLGVCEENRASIELVLSKRAALFREAEEIYREIQLLDPTSHYGYTSETRLHLRQARCEAEEDRYNHLSAACAAIERGLEAVRPDHRDRLLETQAEIWTEVGNVEEVVARLSSLDQDGNINYGYSYHLLSSGLFSMGRDSEAIRVINKGLERFPGDLRLGAAALNLFENNFYNQAIRERFRDMFLARNIPEELKSRVTFLRGVKNYYDHNINWSRKDFRELRRLLGFGASGKIRIVHSDSDGSIVEKEGFCSRRGGQLFIKDQQLGYRILVSNPAKWQSIGQSPKVVYGTGFSLQGFRGRILRSGD